VPAPTQTPGPDETATAPSGNPFRQVVPTPQELSNVDIQWLFESQIVAITRYRCLVHQHQRGAEQCQGFDTLVFPETTPFVLHQTRRTLVVEPSSVLFLKRGDGYRTAHPYGFGDRGTALVVRPDVLREIAIAHGGQPAGSAVFPLTTWSLHPRAQLLLTGLRHWFLRPERVAEPLSLEETSIALA
jgi:hypothetical protein